MLKLIILLLVWVATCLYSHVVAVNENFGLFEALPFKLPGAMEVGVFPYASRYIPTWFPSYIYNIFGSPGSVGFIVMAYMLYKKSECYKFEMGLYVVLCIGKLADYLLRGSSRIYVPFSDLVLTYDLIALIIFGISILRILILKNYQLLSRLLEPLR